MRYGKGAQWNEFVWEEGDENGDGVGAAMPDNASQDCGVLLCAAAGGEGVVEGGALWAVTA